MSRRTTVTINNRMLKIGRTEYLNKTAALFTFSRSGEEWHTLTVNFENNYGPEYKQRFKWPTVVLKDYGENHGIVKQLKKQGVVKNVKTLSFIGGGKVVSAVVSEEWQKKILDLTETVS